MHFLGFAAFLGPVVLIELPVAIIELVNSEGFVGSFNDDGWLKNARMVLIIMRILCAVLLVVAAPFLGKSKTRNPNTLSALKWRAEFDVGEFGASQMYFNALSVWLQPGVGPYSTASCPLQEQIFRSCHLLFDEFHICSRVFNRSQQVSFDLRSSKHPANLPTGRASAPARPLAYPPDHSAYPIPLGELGDLGPFGLGSVSDLLLPCRLLVGGHVHVGFHRLVRADEVECASEWPSDAGIERGHQ